MRPIVLAAASLLAALPSAPPLCAEPAASAAVQAADPLLLEQVPADAQACVAWSVLEHPRYAGSRLEKFHNLSLREKPTAESVAAGLQAAFAALGKDAHLPPAMLAAASRTLAAASVHGGALYVRRFEVHAEKGPLPPNVVLLVRAPKEGPALMEEWKKLLPAGQPAPVAVDFRNGVLRLAFCPGGQAESWIAPGSGLARNPVFLGALRAQGGDGQAVLAFVDAANLVERLKAADAWEKAKKGRSEIEFAKLDAATGLSGLRTLVFAGSFTKDGQWRWDGLVEAPAPRKGALAMMDGAAVSPDLLKRVPASAEGFTAVGFDLGATVEAVLGLVAAEEPDARPQWNKGLADLKAQTGIDAQAILSGLGNQWVAFSDPQATGGGLPGVVVVSPLRNGAAVEDNLGKAVVLGNVAMKQAQTMFRGDSPFQMGFLTDTFRDVTLHRFALPVVSPGYAVKDNALYLGLLPQAIQGAVKPVKESLTDASAYRSLYAEVVPAGTRPRLVSYADLPRMAPHTYGTGLMLQQWGAGFSEMMTGEPAPAQLPLLADLLPVLAPDLSAAWTDAQGLHFRSKGAFPGATFAAGGIDGLPVIATGALGVGILVPVLATARKNANVMKESVNARNVSMGGITYANSNKDYYPGWTSTGKRVDGNYSGLTWMLQESCVIPVQITSTGHTPPACPINDGFLHGKPEDMKAVDAWVRANSCVIYIPDIRRTYQRNGQANPISCNKSDTSNERLEAFTAPSLALDPRKLSVVHGDCSTETVSKAELDEQLKAQYGSTSDELEAEFRAGKLAPGAVMAPPQK